MGYQERSADYVARQRSRTSNIDWARELAYALAYVGRASRHKPPRYWIKIMTIARRAYWWIDRGRGREERNARASHIGLSLPELLDLYMDSWYRAEQSCVSASEWRQCQRDYAEWTKDKDKRIREGTRLASSRIAVKKRR